MYARPHRQLPIQRPRHTYAELPKGPILLGQESNQHDTNSPDWTELQPHHDEHQVSLDVNRSFIYYPKNESEKRIDSRKQELSDVITQVLRCHRMLHYFQGYHDIVQVLLLVLGAKAAGPCVARLSLLRIRDFMLPSMSGTESHLHLLPAILYAVDPTLYAHLSQTQPFFALAATLTLYAHDIEEYGDIARLFDFLLASEASVPLYLFAVIVESRKNELMEIDADEPEMLHAILSKLPKPLNLEKLIHRTVQVFREHPPETLPARAWHRVSANSVLKTTHDQQQLSQQTLSDGERMFEKHDAEIKWKEAWARRRQHVRQLTTRYRRPTTYAGAAVLVVIFAYILRDSSSVRGSLADPLLLLGHLRRRAFDIFGWYFT